MSDQRNNQISKTQVMALAKALEAVETYVPTTWVDDTEPDIDAEHLNHAEQGIKRVTDALNGAVATINNLAAQLANYIPVSKIVDNLLSNDAETVLSGKMGKQLSDLITVNSNAISTLNSASTETASYEPNGFTVECMVLSLHIAKIRITGSAKLDLGTSSTYALCGTIKQLANKISSQVIQYVMCSNLHFAQLVIDNNGNVQLGYSQSIFDGRFDNLHAEENVYIDTLIMLG